MFPTCRITAGFAVSIFPCFFIDFLHIDRDFVRFLVKRLNYQMNLITFAKAITCDEGNSSASVVGRVADFSNFLVFFCSVSRIVGPSLDAGKLLDIAGILSSTFRREKYLLLLVAHVSSQNFGGPIFSSVDL